jgi:hypothetical protein
MANLPYISLYFWSQNKDKVVYYCHVYQVWLITRRGFGLDTGFIRYGDYNYCEHFSTRGFLNPTLSEMRCTDSLTRTNSEDQLA